MPKTLEDTLEETAETLRFLKTEVERLTKLVQRQESELAMAETRAEQLQNLLSLAEATRDHYMRQASEYRCAFAIVRTTIEQQIENAAQGPYRPNGGFKPPAVDETDIPQFMKSGEYPEQLEQELTKAVPYVGTHKLT